MDPSLHHLCRLARRIGTPRSFLVGATVDAARLPLNIVIFSRCDREMLMARGKLFFHHRFVLCLNLETAADLLLDTRRLRFRAGEYSLIFPYQLHTYRNLNASPCWIFLTFEMADSGWLAGLRDRVRPIPPAIGCQLEGLLNAWIEHREYASQLPYHTALLLGELVSAAKLAEQGEHHRAGVPEDEAAHDPAFHGLVSNIHAILTEENHKPRVKDLARRLRMSESFLRAEFRRLAGASLGGYIRQVRLDRAASLLAGTCLRIREIAERCGFDSSVSFSRTFHQCIGLAPLEYRRRFAPTPLTKAGDC